MTMTVRQLRLALDICPDDAEVLCISDTMSEEFPIEDPAHGGFHYFPEQKTAILKLQDEFFVEEKEDEVAEETELVLIPKSIRKTPRAPIVIDVEFEPVIPEEQGDPTSTQEKYGQPA